MAGISDIEWLASFNEEGEVVSKGRSLNVWTGCSKVSQGCKNCYAAVIAKRFWGDRKFTDIRYHEERLHLPYKWKKPCKVFVNSMSDLFHESIPFDLIDKLFSVMLDNERHTFIILTKRAERMREYFNSKEPVVNVWKDVWGKGEGEMKRVQRDFAWPPKDTPYFFNALTIYDEDKFYSYAPTKLDWVIVGGESGPKARPVHPDWIRKIQADCEQHDIPFFFKQWGAYEPSYTAGEKIEETANYNKTHGDRWVKNCYNFDDNQQMVKVGKHNAGRELDGMYYNEFPELK